MEKLRTDATNAIADMGFIGRQGEHMVVLENTDDTHNMVVCTLCSCYPWPVLGLPPVWYKSPPYRSRAVSDPRGVLAEFGVQLPDSKSVKVWDSTAEIRYLVIPQRPQGTEGWSEDRLGNPGHAQLHDRHRPRADTGPGGVMNGGQDLGGVHGLGPIDPEVDEPVFHAEWEKARLCADAGHGISWPVEY